MACHLFVAKPLPKPKLTFYQLDHKDKLKWNLNPNAVNFIEGNAFENVVYNMAAIFFSDLIELPHWGIVMQYGNTDLGQHWSR